MKRKFNKKFKGIFTLVTAILLSFTLALGVCAEEAEKVTISGESGEYVEIVPTEEAITAEQDTQSGEILDNSGEYSQNIFEDVYKLLELNADKIFSILAFVGTIVVSVGYKSGLLPLLRDALSKLKGAIDGVKADGEVSKALTESKMTEINDKIACINQAIEKNNGELARIEWQFENYEQLMAERESMRLILQGQIDMLYAIFMSSALPQYQKDEIGTKIQEMREELVSYEEAVEK